MLKSIVNQHWDGEAPAEIKTQRRFKMTTAEMKKVLAKKLKEEGCYFTSKDIIITKNKDALGDKTSVIILGYEHCPFSVNQFEGDLFVKCDGDFITICPDSDKGYREAMIVIGYYIGTRF